MTIRKILLPLCPPQWDGPALQAGFVAARNLNAHLEGTYIHEPEAHSVGFADSHLDVRHYSEVVERVHQQKREDALAARTIFEGLVTSQNLSLSDDPAQSDVGSASWHEWTGDAAELVTLHGGVSDLVVISLPTLGPTATPPPVREAAIFNTACPVLLVGKYQDPGHGKSIMVAWNRGIQSRRAVAAALPFLKKAESVLIVNVATRAKEGPEPEQMADTLTWHGVKADVKRVSPDRRNVGSMLVEEAHDAGADLLVMGAYSRHHLRERITGGVTKEILAKADFDVLMVQ